MVGAAGTMHIKQTLEQDRTDLEHHIGVCQELLHIPEALNIHVQVQAADGVHDEVADLQASAEMRSGPSKLGAIVNPY